MNKRKSMSRYAFLLLGIVIMSEPVLSYGYTIKQPVESELSAYGNALEDTDQNATVEVAPRELVSWKVYFVDEESRQIQLSAMRSGTILEGEELVIPYANSLIVNGHRWLANEDSPYRINVYGPGEKSSISLIRMKDLSGMQTIQRRRNGNALKCILKGLKKRMQQSLERKQRRFWMIR